MSDTPTLARFARHPSPQGGGIGRCAKARIPPPRCVGWGAGRWPVGWGSLRVPMTIRCKHLHKNPEVNPAAATVKLCMYSGAPE